MNASFNPDELVLSVFPENVLAQAAAASRIRTSAYLSKRLDMRSKTLFSFGSSADTAVQSAFSLSKSGTGWTLGVHISDVGEYVVEGSPLDTEARKRLAAIDNGFIKTDMVPAKIRALTDLELEKDRLALSVLLDIDNSGKLKSITCDESVVRVAHHCVYNEIDNIGLASDASSVFALREKYAPITKLLEEFYLLAAVLYANRVAAGGLDCPIMRRIYTRDGSGKVISFHREAIADMEQAVREVNHFVCAAVGEYMYKKKLPCIFIGKPAPAPETLIYLADVLRIDAEGKSPAELIAEAGELSKGNAHYEFACDAITSALPCYSYSEKPLFDVYCASDKVATFMYPATRYADLLTHRALKTAIAASGDVHNLNMNRQNKAIREAAIAASQSSQFIYSMDRRFAAIAALEYLSSLEVGAVKGFPLFEDGSGSVIILLECGIRAVMPSEYAKDFDFVPGDSYGFEIIALGTEYEPTIVKQNCST